MQGISLPKRYTMFRAKAFTTEQACISALLPRLLAGQCFEKLSFKLRLVLKPIFHLATLFARREAKTRVRQHDWLKLAGEKIRREQVGTVPTFLCVRANKFAKWKIGLTLAGSLLLV